MAEKISDITQHVARRVRVTRMFFKLSLEEAAALLTIPAWMLSYKESGMLNFSYQEFLDMERLYELPWKVFFQDYRDRPEDAGDSQDDYQKAVRTQENRENSDAITIYFAAYAAEETGGPPQSPGANPPSEGSAHEPREGSATIGRWS